MRHTSLQCAEVYLGKTACFSRVINFLFGRIHPFQDGNGRVERLILLKECLKYGITPFVIAENFKQFYYLGLKDWRQGRRASISL